ncbi:hypothetical protein P5G51_019320 [Virgibacillus sp. 179-BFC.A HS]|uniref:Uncharacterized protein n=1 Tax=Tigheibacillus jepli TaxID=3035914 RepID=A0ABU5CLF1_9BACI|nr:hypothetical protein [Virgibacillus sp. 179-BFC.A HS]MDY0407193.1 hypothetical protein [Virgibacillus sp. 179-BFC.A HS]
MYSYKARIEPNNENLVGVVADFYITNSDTNEEVSLWVLNGDYEDKEDLYICPTDPHSEYDDLVMVYMYDVLSDKKFHELQNNIFHHVEFKKMKLVNDDVQIDLKEYFRDEEKKQVKSMNDEMEM